jgi:hypothetical protein
MKLTSFLKISSSMNLHKSFCILFLIFAALASCKQPAAESPANTASSLDDFLKRNAYFRIPLDKNSIGHFVIHGKINKKDALLILDTGASGTCIDFESAKKFNIALNGKTGEAAGYGGDAQTVKSGDAEVEMGDYHIPTMSISAIDLTSVNQAYGTEKSGRIDGVIGADILSGHAAVIDYTGSSLYLKK